MIPAICKFNNEYINFNLIDGDYTNIIEFLTAHKLEFILDSNLDINSFPFKIRGAEKANTILKFLSINSDYPDETSQFISYIIQSLQIKIIIPSTGTTTEEKIVEDGGGGIKIAPLPPLQEGPKPVTEQTTPTNIQIKINNNTKLNWQSFNINITGTITTPLPPR